MILSLKCVSWGRNPGQSDTSIPCIDKYSRFRYLDAFDENSTYSSKMFLIHFSKSQDESNKPAAYHIKIRISREPPHDKFFMEWLIPLSLFRLERCRGFFHFTSPNHKLVGLPVYNKCGVRACLSGNDPAAHQILHRVLQVAAQRSGAVHGIVGSL